MSDDKLHDVRLIKHHLRRQVLTPEQHQAWLDQLEDQAEHGVPTETRFQKHSVLPPSRADEGDEQDDD